MLQAIGRSSAAWREAVNLNARHAVSLVLPALHVGLCVATKMGLLASEGSWGWFLVFLVDFPFSIALLPLLKIADPFLVFGILGTAWWYVISRFAIYCAGRLSAFRRRRF
jgi:hypothetical protein